MRGIAVIACGGLALLSVSCMRAAVPPSSLTSDQVQVDSVTVALWRMDERSGTRVIDSGPQHLDGTAGRANFAQFGRVGWSRSFREAVDSFVYTPYQTPLELPGALTVEAWIWIRDFGQYEDTPIAGRWTEESHRRSWLFTLGGRRLEPPLVPAGPGYHMTLFDRERPGRLWFAYQPETAGPPRVFVSSTALLRERWTHVAVTFDGEVVRFYIDGELDSQFASSGRIRGSDAPLLMGNYFDTRLLTRFAGDLRPETGETLAPYAFEGLLDELRISSVARTAFPSRGR